MVAELEDPLQRVEGEEETEMLLQALAQDYPQSIHIFNRVKTLARWNKHGLMGEGVSSRLYRGADEGHRPDGHTTVLSVLKVDGATTMADLHTTDPSCATLRHVLHHSARIPWEDDILFESVHERCVADVLAELKARGITSPNIVPMDKMYLPRQHALTMHVSPPPGLSLRQLEPVHAEFVNSNWPWAHDGSTHWLRAAMARNRGLSWGLFEEDKREANPVAFVLGQSYGGLGILHTVHSHRRRGLAALVTRASCRAHAQLGLDTHCNIVFPNPASVATFGKLGFKRICKCFWLGYKLDR